MKDVNLGFTQFIFIWECTQISLRNSFEPKIHTLTLSNFDWGLHRSCNDCSWEGSYHSTFHWVTWKQLFRELPYRLQSKTNSPQVVVSAGHCSGRIHLPLHSRQPSWHWHHFLTQIKVQICGPILLTFSQVRSDSHLFQHSSSPGVRSQCANAGHTIIGLINPRAVDKHTINNPQTVNNCILFRFHFVSLSTQKLSSWSDS